jgi:hypothetical protein
MLLLLPVLGLSAVHPVYRDSLKTLITLGSEKDLCEHDITIKDSLVFFA